MDPRSLRVLEYDAVRERLKACATFSLGKELAEKIEPSSQPEIVRRLVNETTEARKLLDGGGRPPMGGISDVRALVMNATRGGALAGRDLQDVSGVLYTSRRMKNYLARAQERAPLIYERFPRLCSFQEVEEAISAAIDSRGEVMDSASEGLRSVRQQVHRLQDSISKRLESIIHSSQMARIIQDPIVTVRNGRYCIPIRTEYKGEFRGIVHDSSASGATVFMEPFTVIEINNEVREAQAAEEREVRKVLAALSLLVGERGEDILRAVNTLGELDLIFARATLANEQKATEPLLNTKGQVDIVNARHPLLTGRVVPITLRLGDDFSVLIITGPNTGGKTVSLKTVGLLTLMAQSGLHIPADSHSKLAIFQQVFADIGDEQSIQQNLSTFSSHMTQVVNVLRTAGPSSLVLLDEIGAGTDPAEGSALAKAVLQELLRRGSRVMVTTHYGELKSFAYTQPGVENASVEFDPVSLEPTYELRIGTPGSSNAFAIASRLGMAPELLREAAGMMGEAQVALTEVIQRAEQDQRDLAEEKRRAAKARMDLEQTRTDYERLLADLKQQRKEMLGESREEARKIVQRAKQRTEELLNLLRQSVQEAQEAKQAIEREAALAAKYAPKPPSEVASTVQMELASIGEEAKDATAEVAEPEPEPAPPPPPPAAEELKVGDAVFVRSVKQRGAVLATPDENENVQVQVGILRLNVPLSDLERAPDDLITVTRYVSQRPRPSAPVPTELHLRGLRVETALYELEKYLDQAAVAGHPRVRIVHGKGTGAVRQAVHARLRESRLVKSFRLGESGEGDTGVTVVELEAG